MDEIRACTFTGHRNMTKQDRISATPLLKNCLIDIISNHNTRDFYIGGARGFDCIAAKVLIELRKERFGDKKLRLILVRPHRNQDVRWHDGDIQFYRSLLNDFDDVVTVGDDYSDGCMKERNQYMIDRSQILISYVDRSRMHSGSLQTLNMAQKKGIPIINIFDNVNDYR